MEETKTIDFSNRPKDQKNGIGGASCPIWIFGNEKSADNDLRGKFEIVDKIEKETK